MKLIFALSNANIACGMSDEPP